jgi:LysM repeat protein
VAPVAAQSGCTNYTVQQGDTLFRIALRYGTTVAAIQSANGLTSTLIYWGKVLCIPTGSGPAPTATTKPGTTPAPTQGGVPATYTVQRGDTLFRIAVKYGTTVAALQQLNGIFGTLIYTGQVLKIPGGSGGSTPAPTAPPGATSTPVPPGNIPATYTIRAGDTLSKIALQFKTTVLAIQQLNGISGSLIYVGQVIKIPGGTGSTPAPTATTPPGATATTAPTTSAPPTTPGGFELGGQVAAFTSDAEAKMKFAGMYWVKRQVRWAPNSKASDFFGLVTEAHNRGFKIMLSVLGDPQYATAANFNAYATFVGEMAGAGADAIEVWNEMNIGREWPEGQISAANYVPMLQKAYNAIKAKNGNTIVISGAPAPTGYFGGCGVNGCDDKPYIEALVAAGGLNYLDCIGIHYNEGVVSPTQTSGDPRGNPNHYTRYYQTMIDTYYNAAGGQKKLCLTEIGYLSGQEWGTLPAGFLWKGTYNLTTAEHAQYLGQAATLSKNQNKVRLMIVFNVDFTLWGADPQAGYAIIRPNGACPACDTLRSVTGGR